MSIDLGINERRVLDLLRQRGALSRASLARETALGAPTLTKITKTLASHGLLRDMHKVRDGHRGKPAQLLAINQQGAYFAGISLQSEYLSICLVDMVGEIKASVTRPLETMQPRTIVIMSATIIKQLLNECRMQPRQLLGAGICMPGISLGALGSGLLSPPPHTLTDEFLAWRDIDLQTCFAEALDIPVWFDNSAKAATLAEAYFGAGQSLRHFATIHIAYGLGGGLILDRKLYRGAAGRAGEFGAAFPYEGTRASGRDLLLFLAQHMEAPPQRLRQLYEMPLPMALVQQWVQRVAGGLVTLCAHIVATLDLQAFILNGLLPAEILSSLAQAIRTQLPPMIPVGIGVPEIIVSRLAQSGIEIGAASLPMHYVTSSVHAH